MSYPKESCVDHVAIRVNDIHWHIRFFREALGMPISEVDGSAVDPKQVWTVGGLQLIADPAFKGPEGRLAHLGIMTEDLDAALAEVARWNVAPMPQGPNWFALPDGLSIELIQAEQDAVAAMLAIDRRSG